MNRRTVLGLAGASALTGLAGCLDGVREHFGLQGVIPVEIHSEAERSHNVVLEARELESGRRSYEESYTVTSGQTVSAPHLGQTEQSLRVALIENETEATVRTVSITPDVDLVTVRLTDDDLVVELEYENGEKEIADGEETEAPDDGTGTDGGNETAENGGENDSVSDASENESDSESPDSDGSES